MVGGVVILALMPGRIVRVLVEQGASVRKGAGLLILEAMKMENEIQAPVDAVIDHIFVEPGQTVEGGPDLAHIEPAVSTQKPDARSGLGSLPPRAFQPSLSVFSFFLPPL